jgi:tRNA 2-thiouridine synthesizing protein A
MSTVTKVDKVVDAKGQMCPMPIVTLKRAFKDLAIGQVVAISATDKGAKRDIPTWCETTGNKLLQMTEDQGVLTFYIQRTV